MTVPRRALAPVPEPLKASAKRAYGRVLSAACGYAHRDYDPARTVLLLGSPRSGTTWLMDIVCSLPGSAPIFEPLNRRQDPLLARILKDEFPRLEAAEGRPGPETFSGRVFAGGHLTRWSSAHASIPSLLRARRFVVKFVRAMRSAGWLSARFPGNRAILLLRHPCAVVSSMRGSQGIWNAWRA